MIDFTGYCPKEIYYLSDIKDLIRLYIFISTNSIYDVCETISITNRKIEEHEAKRLDS